MHRVIAMIWMGDCTSTVSYYYCCFYLHYHTHTPSIPSLCCSWSALLGHSPDPGHLEREEGEGDLLHIRWDGMLLLTPPHSCYCHLYIIHSYIQPTILHTYISTGLKAMYHRDLLHRMHSEGHELANHGFHSVLFTDLSFEDIASNVLRTSGIISNVTNSQVKYFRPPKGNLRYGTWWRWRSVSLLVMMKYCLYMHDALWLWS